MKVRRTRKSVNPTFVPISWHEQAICWALPNYRLLPNKSPRCPIIPVHFDPGQGGPSFLFALNVRMACSNRLFCLRNTAISASASLMASSHVNRLFFLAFDSFVDIEADRDISYLRDSRSNRYLPSCPQRSKAILQSCKHKTPQERDGIERPQT